MAAGGARPGCLGRDGGPGAAVDRAGIHHLLPPAGERGATNTSLVTLLIPVSAVLLGVLFLGERLSAVQAGGMALIGLGLVAIDGWVLAWLRPPRVDAAARTKTTTPAVQPD